MKDQINFTKLKNNCKKECPQDFIKFKLAVLGDCATQHLSSAIKGYSYEKKISLDLFDADYNQIDYQLFNRDSEVYSFNPNAILLYMCSEKLQLEFEKTELANRPNFANIVIEKIKEYWEEISKNSFAKIIQFNFVEYNDAVFGNYGLKVESSFIFQIKKLNNLLNELASNSKNVFLLDLNNTQSTIGRNTFFDEKLYYIAKMPISLEVLPIVSKEVVLVIENLVGKMKKCLVLDLDNTLWGGVIGDDGLEKIQIGELGIGQAYTDFQYWIKELKNRGVLLAVCSKNEEDTAKAPFIKNPEMILKLEDFAIFVANWQDKASNIKFIQETLNIGMDSMVFLDDNPFERDLVRSLIPNIEVPELPEDPALYLKTLKALNLFETISFSKEDEKRTEQYQEESNRVILKTQFSNYNEYLKSLNMLAECKPFDKFQIPRISQLTQRSNQFNLRTIRYTESDVEALSNNKNYITRYFTLRDAFGDYGLVCVLILKEQNDSLFIDSLLMSCRVLKRGMEEYIFNKMVEIANQNGYKKIVGEYLCTPKNAMVKDLYSKMGFTKINDSLFELNVSNYHKLDNYIKEET